MQKEFSLLMAITAIFLLSFDLFAKDTHEDLVFSDKISPLELQMIEKQSSYSLEPIVKEGNIYLFYGSSLPSRYVAVAFDFDSYNKKYVMYRMKDKDIFYLKIVVPLGIQQVRYRYIIDGLWTYDTNNESYDENFLGDKFSVLTLHNWNRESKLSNPTYQDEGKIILYYRAQSGQSVSVAGNFNNWDPFINNLEEDKDHKGLYSIELKLPAGEIFYYFVVGGSRFLDPINPVRLNLSFLRPLSGEGGYNVSSFTIPSS